MEKHKRVKLHEKIKQFEQDTTFYINEIKRLISNTSIRNDFNIISFFTHTTNINHDKENESLIIGTYHIQNIGDKTIKNPYICLKLSPGSPFQFSGKYVNRNTSLSTKSIDTWARINDQSNKEEYWLKPIGKNEIPPSQIISFPNFQAKWIPNGSYSVSIMGFTYCDEFNEGIPAINHINLSGN